MSIDPLRSAAMCLGSKLAIPALLVLISVVPSAQGRTPTMRQAEALLRREQWADAATAFERITSDDPDNGAAWLQLAYAQHAQEQWTAAAATNLRAAEFPEYRATALYNLACARARDGQTEQAAADVDAAIRAGFLDFDLIAGDADLATLREQDRLVLPSAREYAAFDARGGIEMRHAVVEPAGFDPAREYPALVVFAPGRGPRSADWLLENVLVGMEAQDEWIVICLIAPEDRGWFTHPSHHALEDLLKHLEKRYRVAGDSFHLLGFATSCGAALTYSNMSKKYFQTLTLVSCATWGTYDDGDMARWKRMPIHQIVGENAPTLASDRDAHQRLQKAGVRSTLQALPGDGLLIESLRGPELLRAISVAHSVGRDPE